jgi:hypothetical protein
MRDLHKRLILGKHDSVGAQRAVGPSFSESTPELRLYPGNSRTLGVSGSLLSRFMSGSARWLWQETLGGLAELLNLEVEAGKPRWKK